MKKEFSAGAIVFTKNKEIKFLLLKYEKGHWGFPKGNIEKGERIKETARREIEEETGIDYIEFFEGFKEKIDYLCRRDDTILNKEVHYLVGKTKEKEVKLSQEHIDFEWLEYDKAYERITYKNVKDLLKKAKVFLNQIYSSKT